MEIYNIKFYNMNIDKFIRTHNIRPADAIVVKKEAIGILDHYVIYLGIDQGRHRFIANYTKGVRFISSRELIGYLRMYIPVKVNRFTGGEVSRRKAVLRALNRLNENSYNLILNNCEHFANWVQKGLPKSDQVEGFGNGLAMVGLSVGAIGLASNDGQVAKVGLITAVLGLIAIGLSDQRK